MELWLDDSESVLDTVASPSPAMGKYVTAVTEHHELIRPENIPSSSDQFEVSGTFNPGAVQTPDGIVLLVRVVERPREQRSGYTGLPRWNPDCGLTIDWIADSQLDFVDPRVVRRRDHGRTRLTFLSHLRVVRRAHGLSKWAAGRGVLAPAAPYETFGVEDARITPIDGRYYLTYVAVSPLGVVTALASTSDFETFTRHGIVFGPENKDVVLFPERIDGSYVAIHRPSGSAGFARPEMWLARSPDLIHWGQHEHLLGANCGVSRIGAGPPPVRIPEGWLVIYHECTQPKSPGDVGVYSARAMVLDHDDPSRIVSSSRTPLLSPQVGFERSGFVPDVVFPTGIVADGSSLLIYYGACDTSTAVVRMSLNDIRATLSNPISRA